MLATRLFLAVSLLFPEVCAVAQGLNYIHYNTNNSKLPHDIVYHVRQARNGYLWIPTDDGLIGYDGSEMTEYNKGLQSRYVIDTDEEHGRTWISTWKGGIHVLEKGKIRLLRPTIPEGDFSHNTNGLIVYDDLVIGFNFYDYMVFRMDKHRKWLTPILLSKKSEVFWMTPSTPGYCHFIKTADHRLLAYNSSGVYSVKSAKLHRIPVPFIPDEIHESRSGKLYMRKGNSIYRCSNDLRKAYLFYTIPKKLLKTSYPRGFRVLPSGNICVGFSEHADTYPFTFYLINRKSGTGFNLTKEVGSRARPAYIFIDDEGGIWFSTDGDGLYHIFDWKYRLLESGTYFRNAGVNALVVPKPNDLYIGTKKGTYRYWNNQVDFLEQTQTNYVFRLFSIGKDQVAANIGSRWGPRTADLQHNRWAKTGNRIELPDYTLEERIAEPGSLHILNRDRTKQLLNTGFPNGVNGAVEDDQKRIWLASYSGLYLIDLSSGKLVTTHLKTHNMVINCLWYAKESGLWIGTGNGLLLLPNADTLKPLKRWDEHLGLTNRNIRCLYADKPHSLWIGTQNGLFHLEGKHLSVFHKRDGLVADDVVCMARLNDKELAIGSSKGVSIVPLHMRQKSSKATLSIEKILVNGVATAPGKVGELRHSSRIHLLYRSTTFIYPELLQFRYRLNRNEEWVVTTNKSLFLSNLKPGDYQLELSVKKYNSAFSKPVRIRFTILPPWWRSWPFILSVIVCSALLSGFFFRLQFLRQRRILRTRQELSELKMKALQAQLNPHFISNALSVIQYYVLTRNELAVNRYLGRFSDLTRLFLEVSRKGLITLKTEIELLEHYIDLEQMRFEDKIRFTIGVAPGIDPEKTYIPGLLVQPFVENSIHHGLVYLPANQQGTVSVCITRTGNTLEIVIEDNGIGRRRSQQIRQQSTHAFESRSGTIIQELCTTYNSQPGCHIELHTTDLTTATGEAAGTRVLIRISGFTNNTL